ncbi:hypothetical protein [Pseudomonas putida]|uniref:hypothetical protein n=1 Tax=Pseudomonas putida TaxID=303 RepID=UPI00126012CF|nr:hypothetical protein [Pseudomonas putida]
MPATPMPANWIDSLEVFLGTLHTVETSSESAPVEQRRSVYRSYFEDSQGKIIDGQSDWIIAGKEQQAYVFRFLLHSRTDDRLHFMISGSGPDHDKQVGISRNGYLGLYKYATVSDFIKVEPLKWSEDSLLCRLRDHLGQTVKARHDSPTDTPRFSYMNTQKGSEIRFLLQRVPARAL